MYMALARYWVAGVRYNITDTRYWVKGVRYNVHGQVLGNRCKVQGNQVLGTLYQVLSQDVQLVPAVENTISSEQLSQIQSNCSEHFDMRDPDLSLRVATEP